MTDEIRGWAQLLIAATIPLTLVGMLINRTVTKKGIGVRANQFITVAAGIPVVAVLAFEKIIDGAVVGTLLGGIFGYLLSNISNFDRRGSDDS